MLLPCGIHPDPKLIQPLTPHLQDTLSVLLHCGADASLSMACGTTVLQLATSESTRGHRRERCVALLRGDCPLLKLPGEAEAEAEAAAEAEREVQAAAAAAAAATAARREGAKRKKLEVPAVRLAKCASCHAKYEASAAVTCVRCAALGCPACAQASAGGASDDDGGASNGLAGGGAAGGSAGGDGYGDMPACRSTFLCASCVGAYADGEAHLFRLCAAGSKGVDWPDAVRLLSYEADLVRGVALRPMVIAAVRSDDAELLSLLLAAR